MKIVKPDYYDEFCCIANECPFTCCQEWKIAVDKETRKKWGSLKVPKEINGDKKMLKDYVKVVEDVDAIRLLDNGKCPFLDENKLCSIVKTYGEHAISHTCQIFPREIHEFDSRKEFSLNIGCPASLDLLWNREVFAVKEYDDSKEKNLESDVNPIYFDMRAEFCNLMQSPDYTIEEALKMIFFMMLSWDEKEQNDEAIKPQDISNAFKPDFLEQLKAAVNDVKHDASDCFMEQNELCLDIAENYRKKNIYAKVLEPLAKRAELYENESQIAAGLEKRSEFEKVLLSYDKELRLIMVEELFSTLILPGTDMYSMLLKIQWLAMTYVVLRQYLFLFWDENESLSIEELKQIVVMLIRMTGYTEADLEEYLENSFEQIIWDWGYMSLILSLVKEDS
ncbi:MAG: flagellin lysine-N-methylase [Agathobacter sp.]|nr:flagellin lysine-N-methylase [Agathobacter sp.]